MLLLVTSLIAMVGVYSPIITVITGVVATWIYFYFDRDAWKKVSRRIGVLEGNLNDVEGLVWAMMRDIEHLKGFRGRVYQRVNDSINTIYDYGVRIGRLEAWLERLLERIESKLDDILSNTRCVNASFLEMKEELMDMRDRLDVLEVESVKKKRLERVIKQLS